MLHDALSEPLLLLRSLVNLQGDQYSNESQTQLPARAARYFQALFDDDDALKQIPPLDVSHPHGCYARSSHPLVRFRAMVQDTSPSPEVYLSLLQDGHPGGWGLAEKAGDQGPLEVQHLRQREVVWAISVPGESPFVAEHLDSESYNVSDVLMTPNAMRHKDPLLREKHVGVQIKVYDTSPPSLKPTELRTFVGFLTFESLSWGADKESEGAAVPTLHLLFSVKHPSTLVHFASPVPGYTATSTLGCHDQSRPVSHIRDELIRWIADEALGGDRDAAEWVLLVSIARVQSRQPPLFPPSLTLSRLSNPVPGPAQTPALSYVLRHILPLFVDVTLSLPLLNTRPFSPVSRDESLHAGLLQVPAGTTILLSDTGIRDGKITETGIRNIEALRNITTSQTLDYQFPFTVPYQFHTDLSFIFLTEGKHNAFIETHLNVPLMCQASCFSLPEEIKLPSPARLQDFRRLIGRAKTGYVTVTEEISQYIQADFVHERQENKSTTADDLMTRMTVARLLALSFHDTEITREVWQKAKNLDKRRKQRL